MRWFKKLKNLENGTPASTRLDRMVRACREVADDTLSVEAREGVLRAVLNTAPPLGQDFAKVVLEIRCPDLS